MVTRSKITAWFLSLLCLKNLQRLPIALRMKCDSFAWCLKFLISFKATSSSLLVSGPHKPFEENKASFPYRTLFFLGLSVQGPLLSSQQGQSNLQARLQHWIPNLLSPISTATSLNQAVLKSNPVDIFKSLWTGLVSLLLPCTVYFWHSSQNDRLQN